MRVANLRIFNYTLTMFQLTRAASTASDALQHQHQWPLRVTATDMDDDPAMIFVMQAAAPTVADLGDDFSCVASVQQLTELPPTEPGEDSSFYRVNTFTLMCRSPELLDEAWFKIKSAVQDLANNINASVALEDVETVTILPESE